MGDEWAEGLLIGDRVKLPGAYNRFRTATVTATGDGDLVWLRFGRVITTRQPSVLFPAAWLERL